MSTDSSHQPDRLLRPRPQDAYRARLVGEIEALRPARLLEVGCGGGGFLRSVAHLDIELVGVDPDEESLRTLSEEGFEVRHGRAEGLDFPDGSFDVVVFCFTAHHVEDWTRALHEALRVGEGSVVVLDPWYDLGIPSQAVAARFDRWCKVIDRAGGMVHQDPLDADDLLAPIADRPSHYDVRVEYLLSLQEFNVAELEEFAGERLAPGRVLPQWREELASIVDAARRDGFSDDGAILLSVRKSRL